MANVTYYVAMPFFHDEAGILIAGAAEECQHSSAALRRAEAMSRAAGSIGAVAFSRSGDRWPASSAMRMCSENSARCRTIWLGYRVRNSRKNARTS